MAELGDPRFMSRNERVDSILILNMDRYYRIILRFCVWLQNETEIKSSLS
jgi:hypothetical protein